MKFTIYRDKAGEFRFRLVATNGNVLASSEGYKAEASAMKAIERIKVGRCGSRRHRREAPESIRVHRPVPRG